MFIEEKMKVKVTNEDDSIYTGTVYKIVIQNQNENDKPHALVFITQDKEYRKQEGDFGCIALWIDKVKKIEVQ